MNDKNRRAHAFISSANNVRTRIPDAQKRIELSKQNLRQQSAHTM